MVHRLLALNIDGTVVQSNGRISKATKEAIEYVQQKGVHVTLVTSKSFSAAKKIAKALKLKSYIVTHEGAYIATAIDKPLFVHRINEDIAYELARFLETFSCNIRLVHERFSIGNKARLQNNLLAKAVFSSDDPIQYSYQFVDHLSETLQENPVSPLKMEVFFERKKDLQEVVSVLKGMFKEVQFVQVDQTKLELLPLGVSRLFGLLYLAEHLGISHQEIVVIGQSYDDLDLLEFAGLGVAMGNAPKEVKRAADWITRSNDDNGVAYMVKEHFRKQQPIEFLRRMNIIK